MHIFEPFVTRLMLESPLLFFFIPCCSLNYTSVGGSAGIRVEELLDLRNSLLLLGSTALDTLGGGSVDVVLGDPALIEA